MANRAPSTSPFPATTYDQAPYRSKPNPLSHPFNMALVAQLLGLPRPKLQGCRVLEIGSGTGTGLLPLAEDLPDAEILGIDLSATQVAMCNDAVATLGYKNIRFQQMDLMDVGADLGKFDYIIAHGMYSWVPDNVRDKLLSICCENLTDDGVVYVSYNVLPGWHMTQMLRDAATYHVKLLDDPQERVKHARELVDFLCEGIAGAEGSLPMVLKNYAEFYREHIRKLGPAGESLLLHDLLAGINHPVYFQAFTEHADRFGLEYLAEASFELSRMAALPARPRDFLEKSTSNLVEMEQYLDYLDMRNFRQSLLCKKGRTIDRSLSAQRLRGAYVRAELSSVSSRPQLNGNGPERFMASDGATIATKHPLSKAALQHLCDIAPRSIEFCELIRTARMLLGERPSDEETAADDACTSRDAQDLAQLLLQSYSKRRDIILLRAHDTKVTERVSEKPMARPYARYEARTSLLVTNAYHLAVELEPLPHALLQLLDGTRDREALIAGLLEMVNSGTLQAKWSEQNGKGTAELRAMFERIIDQVLKALAQRSLLVA